MRPKLSEHQEQVIVVSWFKLQYRKFEGCIIASMNGAHISGTKLQRAKKIAKHKREGMKVGVSDLFIAVPKNGYHGLWIEMKAAGKTIKDVTDEQQKHLGLMNLMGYRAEWAAGADEAKKIIEEYML